MTQALLTSIEGATCTLESNGWANSDFILANHSLVGIKSLPTKVYYYTVDVGDYQYDICSVKEIKKFNVFPVEDIKDTNKGVSISYFEDGETKTVESTTLSLEMFDEEYTYSAILDSNGGLTVVVSGEEYYGV